MRDKGQFSESILLWVTIVDSQNDVIFGFYRVGEQGSCMKEKTKILSDSVLNGVLLKKTENWEKCI